MKTPMQEAIDKVQSLKEIDAVINPIDVITTILKQMLEKEKEVIMDAYNSGQQIPPFEYAEKYYNETFNSDTNYDRAPSEATSQSVKQ